MNKKGQSLIVFVLILPLIVLFLAFLIDSSLNLLNKTKMEGVIKNNIEIAIRENIRDIDRIKKTIQENDKDINVDVEIKENVLYIKALKEEKNVFGNILKLDLYNFKLNYCASYWDKKIKEEC